MEEQSKPINSSKRETVVSLRNISKTYYITERKTDTFKNRIFHLFDRENRKTIKALSNINLNVRKGECLGIIGSNGSGKTTLTKVISGALIPDKGGEIKKVGNSMLMNLGLGMSHELSTRENIYLSGVALGLKIKEVDQLFDKILTFAELEDFVNTKIKYFSTGMTKRLAFSIAVNVGAEIMIMDEVLAVGDQRFKKKAERVFKKRWMDGKTMILVSHGLSKIQKYCNRAVYLKDGKIEFVGKTKRAIHKYKKDNKEVLPQSSPG